MVWNAFIVPWILSLIFSSSISAETIATYPYHDQRVALSEYEQQLSSDARLTQFKWALKRYCENFARWEPDQRLSARKRLANMVIPPRDDGLLENPLYRKQLEVIDEEEFLFSGRVPQKMEVSYQHCPWAIEELARRLDQRYSEIRLNEPSQLSQHVSSLLGENIFFATGFAGGAVLRGNSPRLGLKSLPWLLGFLGWSIPRITKLIKESEDPYPPPLFILRLNKGPRPTLADTENWEFGIDLASFVTSCALTEASIFGLSCIRTIGSAAKTFSAYAVAGYALSWLVELVAQKGRRALNVRSASENLRSELIRFESELEELKDDLTTTLRIRSLRRAADEYYMAIHSPLLEELIQTEKRKREYQEAALRGILHQEWVFRGAKRNQYPDVDLTLQCIKSGDARTCVSLLKDKGLLHLVHRGQAVPVGDPFALGYPDWIKDTLDNVLKRSAVPIERYPDYQNTRFILENIRPQDPEWREDYEPIYKFHLNNWTRPFAKIASIWNPSPFADFSSARPLSTNEEWIEYYFRIERNNRLAASLLLAGENAKHVKSLMEKYAVGEPHEKTFLSADFAETTVQFVKQEMLFWNDTLRKLPPSFAESAQEIQVELDDLKVRELSLNTKLQQYDVVSTQ